MYFMSSETYFCFNLQVSHLTCQTSKYTEAQCIVSSTKEICQVEHWGNNRAVVQQVCGLGEQCPGALGIEGAPTNPELVGGRSHLIYLTSAWRSEGSQETVCGMPYCLVRGPPRMLLRISICFNFFDYFTTEILIVYFLSDRLV